MTPRDYRDDWEELGRREPYYAVLTDPRYLAGRIDDDARREFFVSGERDVDELLRFAADHTGRDFHPKTALDFGCGVGRLTLALAGRVDRVTGCDVSPAMIARARAHASTAGVANATFITTLDQVAVERFDFICSLIVFQHIPPRDGLTVLSRLLSLLSPSGVAAMHFTLARPGSRFRRFARRLRAASPLVHRIALRLEGNELNLPYMQMNEYDGEEIARVMREATGSEPAIIPRTDGEIAGAIYVVSRTRASE